MATGESLRVLIVEDSDNDALLLLRELGKAGFDPEHRRVQSTSELTEALSEETWDIVLSDYRMPRFTGLDAFEIVHGRDEDLPVIIISGTIGEDIAVEAMKMGVHDYLMKGNLKRLGPAMRRELQEARMRRERRLGIDKIQHLNRVLRAIRNVNQLIVREKRRDVLIESACDTLARTRGFHSAWIALSGDSPDQVEAAQHGLDPAAFDELTTALQEGELPACCKRSREEARVVATPDPASACQGCPLAEGYASNAALTVELRHEDRRYGYLGVAVPHDFAEDEEEASLLLEIAGDIAFALHGMEVEAERKRAETTLRLSEEKFRRFFDDAPDCCYMVSAEGEIIDANRCALDTLGYEKDELVGKPVLSVYAPEAREEAKKLFDDWKATGEIALEELVIVTRAGERRNVLLSASMVENIDGSATHSISVQKDITERKRLQAQLAQADRLSSMGMLAAGVAHEINNPLSYILYNLESLTDDLPELLDAMRTYQAKVGDRFGDEAVEEAAGEAAIKMNPAVLHDIQDRFGDALEGTRRIRAIARGLGTFSRLERDQLVPVNLMHVVEAALTMCFNEIKYRARLVKDYGKTPTVMANEGRLSQVFLNLLVNAAHAIDEGDVEGNEIRVRTWAEGERVCAEVRDSGKGIAPEHVDKLFEPFFTTKAIGVGSGLGLPISKGIIEGYNGTITVESEVGKGTAFTIRLPVRAEEVAPAPVAAVDPEQDRVRGRILIVDDEDGIRAAMARVLRGHETVEAGTGQAARELLEQDQQFDLILCDMMMPEVSGMDLHVWLSKEHPKLAKQLIFITGGAFTPRARDYLKQVDNMRLEKPFDVANFKKIVSELIVAYRNKDS